MCGGTATALAEKDDLVDGVVLAVKLPQSLDDGGAVLLLLLLLLLLLMCERAPSRPARRSRRPQVPLRVDDDAGAALGGRGGRGQGALQQRVPGGERDAEVAALDDEADVGQDAAHALEPGVVVAQEVAARDVRGGLEDLAGAEAERRRGGGCRCGPGQGGGGRRRRGHSEGS
ncbi:hypothetical protein VTK73DRAFT_5239 [Phialemonium thermophilum]|uniref:Uncharacterized protein n=1 Tax=Phialemonium thermophilum TaxID=223376 RepID=A0ABR3V2N4_9PEZI